jgi:peptide/nickel transport system permease protein
VTTGAADILVREPARPPARPGGVDLPDRGGAGGFSYAARSPRALFWRRLRGDRFALVSLAFIALLLLIAIAAPLVVEIAGVPGPYVQNSNATDAFGSPLGPSAAHPFGVDQLGRDVFARVVYGARVSLEVGILGTAIATLIGTVVGLLAGFYRGWVDTLLSRTVDVVLSFPVLLLGLGLGAACGVRGCVKGLIQPGTPTIVAIVALVNWTYIARIVRGQVLSLREQEFVQAARALGASNARIVCGEILPNLLAPLIVYSSLLIPQNILLEAALSFLGLGVPPPLPSWGLMIAEGKDYMFFSPWVIMVPGVALFVLVLGINLVGDGLRNLLGSERLR